LAQEYFINDENLQNKIRQLLPSQGGAGAGFDLSASTQIVPIVDLTESAEGSEVRQDLQTALSHDTVTAFAVSNTSTTVITNTGYWRITGASVLATIPTGSVINSLIISDGVTDKTIWQHEVVSESTSSVSSLNIDQVIFLRAGDSFKVVSNGNNGKVNGSVRQIATIDGILIDP